MQGCRRTDLYWLTGYRRKGNFVFFLNLLKTATSFLKRDLVWFIMLKTIT